MRALTLTAVTLTVLAVTTGCASAPPIKAFVPPSPTATATPDPAAADTTQAPGQALDANAFLDELAAAYHTWQGAARKATVLTVHEDYNKQTRVTVYADGKLTEETSPKSKPDLTYRTVCTLTAAGDPRNCRTAPDTCFTAPNGNEDCSLRDAVQASLDETFEQTLPMLQMCAMYAGNTATFTADTQPSGHVFTATGDTTTATITISGPKVTCQVTTGNGAATQTTTPFTVSYT